MPRNVVGINDLPRGSTAILWIAVWSPKAGTPRMLHNALGASVEPRISCFGVEIYDRYLLLPVCMPMCPGTQQRMLCHRLACAIESSSKCMRTATHCFSWIACQAAHACSQRPTVFHGLHVKLHMPCSQRPTVFHGLHVKLHMHADSGPMVFHGLLVKLCCKCSEPTRLEQKEKVQVTNL